MMGPTYQAAVAIIDRLEAEGHEAYFVGGTVRDLLLNRAPHDYDVVTSARPAVTQRLFPHHIPAGIEFGVVQVITPAGIIDVATYRTEAGYADRRRPDTVAWATLRNDVLRRDFTINGLALNPKTRQIADYVDGQRDLNLGLIRTIGKPSVRFHEDPVRMLRAVRLKNQLGFQYDPATYTAIKPLAQQLTHVANERIRTELDRMLALPHRVGALADLDDLGLLDQLLPEVAALHGVPQPRQYHREGDVFAHTMSAVGALAPDAPSFLVWATLLHDVAKPQVITFNGSAHPTIHTPDHATRSAAIATDIATRLAFSRDDRETIAWLIEHHMSLKDIEAMRPARRERFLLDPRFPWLLELHKADVLGTDPSDLSLYEHDLKLYAAMKASQLTHRTSTPTPLLTGDELVAELGITEGPQIGELLETVRDAQLKGDITSRDQALDLARRLIAEKK